MNKPTKEFEIDEPTVVDEQGRSPNKEEVIDPDAHELETGGNRSGEQGISNRPRDEEDEDDAANGSDNQSGDDRDSDRGEAGNLGRDAGATQGNQQMNRPGDRSTQGQNQGEGQKARDPHAQPFKTQKKPPQGSGTGSDKRSVN